jgi:hypothetical protein
MLEKDQDLGVDTIETACSSDTTRFGRGEKLQKQYR